MGPVELTVADRERSRLYYEQTIGLRVLEENGSRLTFGVNGTELLVLVEEPRCPAVGRSYGSLPLRAARFPIARASPAGSRTPAATAWR